MRNAEESFHRHKLRRAWCALPRPHRALADRLGLEQAPLRIECYDLEPGPTDTVGSMVVFEDGLPKRSDYRRFRIKDVVGQTISLWKRCCVVASRVCSRSVAVAAGRRFSYPPALVVVDGGRGQLSMASKVLEARAAIHRPREAAEVCFPDHPDPLMIPRGSRPSSCSSTYATRRTDSRSPTTGRSVRSARSVRPSTTCRASDPKGLLKRFGSLARVRLAEPEQIAEAGSVRSSPPRSTSASMSRSSPAALVREPGLDRKVSA